MWSIVATCIGLILLYLYFFLPVFAWGFTDWSIPLLIVGWILFVVSGRILWQQWTETMTDSPWKVLLEKIFHRHYSGGEKVVNIGDRAGYRRFRLVFMLAVAMLGVGLLNLVVLPLVLSHPLLFSHAYRNLLGPVQESSFTADIEPINLSQIRIIDEETAVKLADKKIGEVPALGSTAQLGQLVLQKVQGKLYYVGALEHRGFFQWLYNMRGSRGYIMVSATTPQDVRLVQDINGREVRIKYQNNAFIFDYLPRYLYAHGIVNVGMMDFSFEVDDDLNPYWVVTLYRNKVGFSGADAVGVVLVNAETGQISRYGINDVPAWVDRIQPESFIYHQIQWWGEYVNGFWNAMLAKTGTLKPAGDRLHLIYGNDNSVYWYTGITSSGQDQSTVGFLLVNSRTKETKWYKVAGATEAAARKSAEGQVQEKSYRAGDTILYNIGGVPTYIAPLKDKEGLLKMVAFVSVENYNLVGVGPDIESALRAYQQNLLNKGNLYVPGNEIKQIKLAGKVSRFMPVVKGGESSFYFTLAGDPRIFTGTAGVSPKLPLTKEGDTVTIVFNDSREMPITILQFDNTSY